MTAIRPADHRRKHLAYRLGRARTCDRPRIRRELYQLSYESLFSLHHTVLDAPEDASWHHAP
jgi:hypothetical protein